MSKYFSFLRKKRNPSLRDEETESFSSRGGRKKNGVRKSSTSHPQSLSHLSTSSASLSSQTGDENRQSTYSLDSYELKPETGTDPFQSDSDSLLDNASVEGVDVDPVDEEKKNVTEAEFENNILEGASEVFEKVGVIKRAVCNFVEEEDEGHVIEYDDEDNDNLIDDFMDEALYDLEENVSTNVIVGEGQQREISCDDKSSEDITSQNSSKNLEEISSLALMESVAHDCDYKFDQIPNNDIDRFEIDMETKEKVEMLTSSSEVTGSTEFDKVQPTVISRETQKEEVEGSPIEMSLIDISIEIPKKEVDNVKVSPTDISHIDVSGKKREKGVDVTPTEVSHIDMSGETPDEKVEINAAEISLDEFKANESKKEAIEDNDNVEALKHEHSNINYTKDKTKEHIHLESSDSNMEVFLTDVDFNEIRVSGNSISDDQSIKVFDCDKSVFPVKNKEEAGNQLLTNIPNLCVEQTEFDFCHSNKENSSLAQNIIEDSVLSKEKNVLSFDMTEAAQPDFRESPSDSELKTYDKDGEGGRESVVFDKCLISGEAMLVNITTVEKEIGIEDDFNQILNTQSEDENRVEKIKHIENEDKVLINMHDNIKEFETTNVIYNKNDDNTELLNINEEFDVTLDNSADSILLGSTVNVSSKKLSTNDEVSIEELANQQLTLGVEKNKGKDPNFASPTSSGQCTDVDDDDEFDSAKEDFSNEEEDSSNQKELICLVSERNETEHNHYSIITENSCSVIDKDTDVVLSKSSEVIPSQEDINASHSDEINLIETTILNDNQKENLTVSNPGESVTFISKDDHLESEEELEAKTPLELRDTCISSEGKDLGSIESAETLSLLLSSSSFSKHLLLKRANSSSVIEANGGGHNNRRRSSTSEASIHRYIEGEERCIRPSFSVPDDREQIIEEPSKKVQSVNEDIFLLSTVNADHQKAEAKLAQRRAARAEARELRLRELEKQQQQEQQENNEEEEQYAASSYSPHETSVSRAPSTPRARSSVPVNSLSRMSSEDSLPDDHLPSSARELKADLQELEEKFRKAMVLNAQLDNEKATLMYEVEFLKDKYADLEEAHLQLTKEHKKKSSENEQLRKLSNKLKEEVKMVRRVLQERDELIQEYGLVLIGEENGEEGYDDMEDEERTSDTIMDLSPRKIGVKKALLSQEASELLSKGAAKGSLDVRLRKYAEDKHELEDEVRRLKLVLEEELSNKRRENGLDYEKHKETTKSLNEYKFKIQKAEAEVSTLQANVARLESLVTRFKASTEELEKSEEELKSEKRRLQRELREVKERCDELETSKAYVKRQYEKLLHDRGRV